VTAGARPARGTPPGELARLPLRGPGVRELGLPVPGPNEPAGGVGAPRLAPIRGGRPLKRWRYVAAFGPELMLCAGDARIGPLPQRWWAIAEPGERLRERTGLLGAGLRIERDADGAGGAPAARVAIEHGDVRVDLTVMEASEHSPIEVASPSGARSWAWTRKQAGLPARAVVELAGRRREMRLRAVIDDSSGYHARRTAWRWTTGVGRARSGERVAWNLVRGVHDSPGASERTVWVDCEPRELGPVRFAADLSGVELAEGGRLRFSRWATREHRTNLGFLRSDYRQPFGEFSGTLPGGLELVEGFGVMEEHDATW
jgi:hypothetical protein